MKSLTILSSIKIHLEIVKDCLTGLLWNSKTLPKDINSYLYFEIKYDGVRGGEFYLNDVLLGYGQGDDWVSSPIKDTGKIVKQTNYGEIRGSYSGSNPGMAIKAFRYQENKDDKGIGNCYFY